MSQGRRFGGQEKYGLAFLAIGAMGSAFWLAYSLFSAWYYFNGNLYLPGVIFSCSILAPCVIARETIIQHRRFPLTVSAAIGVLDALSAFSVIALVLWLGVFPLMRPVNWAAYGQNYAYYLFYDPALPVHFWDLMIVWMFFIALRVGAQFAFLGGIRGFLHQKEVGKATIPQPRLSPASTGQVKGQEDPAALREALLLFRISDMVNELKSLREEINSRGMSYNMPAASGSAPRYSVVSSSKAEKTPGTEGTMVVTPKVELVEQETGKLPDAAADNPWSSVLSARKTKKGKPDA